MRDRKRQRKIDRHKYCEIDGERELYREKHNDREADRKKETGIDGERNIYREIRR